MWNTQISCLDLGYIPNISYYKYAGLLPTHSAPQNLALAGGVKAPAHVPKARPSCMHLLTHAPQPDHKGQAHFTHKNPGSEKQNHTTNGFKYRFVLKGWGLASASLTSEELNAGGI